MYPASQQRRHVPRPTHQRSQTRPPLLEFLERRQLLTSPPFAIPFGTPGSWNDSGNVYTKALDGDFTTFFDAPVSQAFVGLRFNSPPTPFTAINFAPRPGLAQRMVGGVFQASNDGSTWTTLATVTSAPPEGTFSSLPVTDPGRYTHVRYLSPEGGYGNIAEFRPIRSFVPAAPSNLRHYTYPHGATGDIVYTWTDNATGEHNFESQLSTSPDFSSVLHTFTSDARQVRFYNLPAGTYYFRTRTTFSSNYSIWIEDTPADLPATPAPPSNVTHTIGLTSLTFNWTPPTSPLAGYQAVLSADPNFLTDIRQVFLPANATTITFSDLPQGRGYYFYVAANFVDGQASISITDNATVAPIATVPLTGAPIGTAGSWNDAGNDLTKAFDHNPATFFDAPTPQAWAGLDLDSPVPLSHVRFLPRQGLDWRMVDGLIQGSNDLSDWTTLATITNANLPSTPGSHGEVSSNNQTPFRYVRYLSPTGGYGNVAELEFFGQIPVNRPPATPSNVAVTAGTNSLTFTWQDNSDTESYFIVEFASNPIFTSNYRTLRLDPNTTTVTFDFLTPSQNYYFRIRADNFAGTSEYATLGPTFLSPFAEPARILGDPIGTPGSWNNSGNDLLNAFDGDLDTFFDAPTSQAWVGYDLAFVPLLTEVRIAPRAGLGARMVGGEIQASNDGFSWTTLRSINTAPPDGVLTSLRISTTEHHRYFRYFSPEGGYGNLAELQFFTDYGIAMP